MSGIAFSLSQLHTTVIDYISFKRDHLLRSNFSLSSVDFGTKSHHKEDYLCEQGVLIR